MICRVHRDKRTTLRLRSSRVVVVLADSAARGKRSDAGVEDWGQHDKGSWWLEVPQVVVVC